TTTTASPCPDAGFNEDDPDYCNTPIGTWTVEKKAFCCQHFHRGCPGVTYDCDVDSHIWQYAWSLTKKAWCCVHHHVGCYPHYDCDTAVTSWSPEKKVWCCHHEKKGCELYDCYGPPHLWSEPHKDWCCRNHGQGCSEEEPFHCHGGAGQNIYWSPEKKDWCCTHKHIGCSEP
ncbi:Ank2, partial [Symbiodinium sp. KB8]